MGKIIGYLGLLLLSVQALGQGTYITGNVFDNEKRTIALEGVSVRNLVTNALVMTNKEGYYAIQAKKGDVITYGMIGYETDTVYLINLFPKNVYLRYSVNNLQPVHITTVKVSPYLDAKDLDATPARQLNYSKDRGGLRLALGYGKYRRQQEKERRLEEEAEILEEISENFNREVIQKLVSYKEKDLDDYIALYKPTVEQVKAETPFNYTYYIASTFHEWKKLPPEEKKLPPLPKLKPN